MRSERILKDSIWIAAFIIGLIMFASNVFALAAAAYDYDSINFDDGTSGGGGGGTNTYRCTGSLYCGGVNEVYPVKAQQFCQYNYEGVCDWDTDACVNLDGASCSDLRDTSCSSVIGCNWGSTTTTTTTSTCTGGTSYCANLGRCVNLYSDESACGSCSNVCYGNTLCQSGSCVSSATTTCDGIEVPNDDVECNINTPEPCNVTALHTGTQRCVRCEWSECISNTGYCGDGIRNGEEPCDVVNNTRPCSIDGVRGVNECKADCTGWEELCIPTINCFPSCTADGKWISFDDGFSMNDDHVLISTDTGTRTIMSEGMDLFAGKTYTFDADIDGSVIIYLNNTCLSNTTFTQKDCGVGQTLYSGPSSVLPRSFTMPTESDGHVINGLYYRNVSIHAVFTGAGSISNISLRESSEAHYDYLPTDVATYGCCPNDYCWDGFMCVNSRLWMDNASYPPLWNTFSISAYNGSHVPAEFRHNAEGYRCVKSDANASASWVYSYVKYDPNFVGTGYCSRATDCFLNPSTGCVDSGYMSGNNYCHLGSWTTRSYILATLFQDLAQGSPYVLHCYDNETMVHNAMISYATSACVLTEPGETRVIIGLVPGVTQPIRSQTYISDINRIIDETVRSYSTQFGYSPEYPEFSCTSENAELIAGSNFSICVESNEYSGLFIYYETNYGFLVISNERIVGIDTPTLWDNVKQFFRGIFTRKLSTTPYTTLDYVTSYDKIYILRDQGYSVTAIEEKKYDESLMKPVNVFYIQYEGSDNSTNPINDDQLLKAINKSISRRSILDVDYTIGAGNQELIIRTDNSTGVWKYFTAMLRTRNLEQQATPGDSTGIRETVVNDPGAPAGAIYGSSNSDEILSESSGQGSGSGESAGTGSGNSGSVIITGVTNAAPTCFDNILNQGEIGFADCNGPCAPCSCNDGIANQDEWAGIPDCGGVCTGVNLDCPTTSPNDPGTLGSGSTEDTSTTGTSGTTTTGTCFDGIANQDEWSGIPDCGGVCTGVNLDCPTTSPNDPGTLGSGSTEDTSTTGTSGTGSTATGTTTTTTTTTTGTGPPSASGLPVVSPPN